MGRVGAIIVAAGKSSRMGGEDKIFAVIAGKALLAHTVDVFENCPSVDEVVIVLSEDGIDRGTGLVKERQWSKVSAVCLGGARRQDSVREGLLRLSDCDWVVVHDGARPCVSRELIETGLKEAREFGAALAAVPVTDTVKVVSPDSLVEETLPRQRLWAAQTPQVFRSDIISEAHQQVKGYATDDAALVERLNHRVKVYRGSDTNIKVTTPDDLVMAEAFLRGKEQG
jgi:2-C-methyl-D-erythritol 4-phosphate cytidylyltransferase